MSENIAPTTFEELKDDVISGLVDMGYKANDARVAVNLCAPETSFEPLFREALAKMTTARGSGKIHAAPKRTLPPAQVHGESGRKARVTRERMDRQERHIVVDVPTTPAPTTPPTKCQCSPDCESTAMLGRLYAWGHLSKWRREARAELGKRTLRAADTQAIVQSSVDDAAVREFVQNVPVVQKPTAPSDGFREISVEEFQERFTRSGVTLDPWVRKIIEHIKALPLGGRATIELPKGKSAGGFRDSVGRFFKTSSFVVRIFSQKGNDRLVGIAKEERPK